MPKKLKVFKRVLTRLDINPSDIKLIVLTHSHFDHSGSAQDIEGIKNCWKVLIDSGVKMIFPGHGKPFLWM